MSVVDDLKGLIGDGDLSGLVQKFREGGLDEQVSSWISTGSNLPIVGEQIKNALGNDVVAGFASKLGIAPDAAADVLAEQMPQAVDELTPSGTLP